MIKILDFWADWCYPCKIMDPVIEELEKELKDKVVFEKINVDKDHKAAEQYQVMSIPTYVILKDGQEVDRLVGATSADNFLNFIKKHISSE